MATKDRVTIELYVDDQGTVKIRNAKVAVQELGPAGERSGQQLGSGLDYAASRAGSLATQLLALVGVTASVAGAGYLVKQAFSSWYGLISDGIGQVEELKKTIVGTSYILTSMSEVKPVDLGKTYDAWKDYFGWLHRASMEADKKAAASAQEIFTVGVELRKKGISIVSNEDVDTLGRLTDLMKAVTPAYASLANQVRGEVEAMMSGANRMGAQTAMVLSQIDPKFKENIANARRLGTEMEYFRSLLPSIRQYTFDMMGTWDAVSSSMKSAWSVVQVKAFGDAHKEVVSMVSQLTDKLMKNGELTKDGERLAEELSKAWSKARDKITDAIDYMIKNFPQIVTDVGNIASGLGAVGGAAFRAATGAAELVKELRTVSQDPALMMILGAALGSRAGAIGAGVGAFAGLGISQQLKNYSEVERGLARQQAAGGVGGGGEAAETYYPLPPAGALGAAPPTPKTRPPGDTGKGGSGGKGRDTTESLESLLMQLRQEEAKLTEGAYAGVEAWAEKLNAKVRKLAMDDEQLKRGMLAVSEVKAAKEQKISDDLNKWYLGQMHRTTAAQLAEDAKKLDSVKGHAKEEAQVREVMAAHALERAAKLALAENQQQKAAYDSLAQNSVLIADQVFWKEKAWEAEKKITAEQLEQWFIGKDLAEGKKDEYRGLLALTNQAKEYNLARQKAVDLGTLEGWAIERAGEALKKNTTIKDAMTGIESFFEDALTQGIQGALSKTKTDWAEVAATMAQSLLLNLAKKGLHEAVTKVAGLIAGGKEQRGLSPSSPLYVSDVGSGSSRGAANALGAVPAFERKAEKIGYTLGGGKEFSWAEQTKQLKTYDKLLDQMFKGERKDLGGIQKLQDHYWKDLKKDATSYSKLQDGLIDQNQELFRADYLTEYQSTFSDMVGNITSVWQLGQGLMTAAGASGEAQRIAGIAGFAMQGISILAQFAKSAILMEAWQAAAAAYKSAMAGLPFPINAVVAPVYAAATFVAVSAMGAFGSGMGGGGSTLANSPGMQSTGAGYTEGYHTGGLVAHSGLLVAHNGLANDERLVKVLTGEPILQRSAMDTYRRMGMSFDDLNNGRMPALPLPVPVRGADSGGNAGQIIQHHTTTHIMVVTQDGKVISKQTKREIINLMKDKDVQREIGIRVH